MERQFTSRYQPCEADTVAITRTLWRHHLLSPASVWATIALAAAGIALLYLALSPMVPLWIIFTAVVIGVPMTVVLVIVIFAPIAGRKQFRQAAHLQSEIRLGWDLQGIEFEVDRGSSRYRWDEFHKWSLTNGHLMLFLTDAIALGFPRSAFGEGELAAIEGLKKAGVRRF